MTAKASRGHVIFAKVVITILLPFCLIVFPLWAAAQAFWFEVRQTVSGYIDVMKKGS